MFKKINVHKIIVKYALKGEILKIENYGYGHINKTIKITTQDGDSKFEYILQQINRKLFKNVGKLMNNINLISLHLQKKCRERNGDIQREVLRVIPTKTNKTYCRVKGKYYRIYHFIKNSVCLQQTDQPEVFELVGKAFGDFEKDLADFDATRLYPILKNFHNTKIRYYSYLEVFKKDKFDRVKNVENLHKIIVKRSKYANILVNLEKNGKLPIRVTHNDTKLNNIVLDKNTLKPLAILDLDTVMPATLLYDFGDAIRFGCNTASEEEQDLLKVGFNLKLFESFAKGYLSSLKDTLTKNEIKCLAISPLVITFELAIRFLTDYLDGDKYFKINFECQNLIRAKVQLKLLLEMEKNYKEMQKIIKKYI